MRNHFLLLALLGLLTLSACRKDKPEDTITPTASIADDGVYITCEGNFQWGNAKVSYYDITSATATEDLYQPANGMALGDVCQSMTLHDGQAYVVVNNSGKVVVIDPNSFIASATISGFTSPRHFLPVSSSKAYVTDIASNSIAVVDLTSNSITGSIPCAGWTEELALANGKVFVTNQSRNHVYVIDANSDQLIDSVAVSRGGNSIVEDVNGKLWVICTGGGGTSPALYRIDPQTNATEASFNFGASANPWRLNINGAGDTLYFLNDAVFRMSIADAALPTDVFIPTDGRNLYGIGVDPNSGVVYVADAIDYVQRGVISRYATDGTVLNSFLAGTVPGTFAFR